jgi:hypothetical protein
VKHPKTSVLVNTHGIGRLFKNLELWQSHQKRTKPALLASVALAEWGQQEPTSDMVPVVLQSIRYSEMDDFIWLGLAERKLNMLYS